MRFKHYLYAVAMLATLGVSTTSCDDDDEDEIAVVPDGGDDDANGDSTEGANFTVSGDVGRCDRPYHCARRPKPDH